LRHESEQQWSNRLSHRQRAAPLSPRTFFALGRVASRELLWGLRDVSREVNEWRQLARAIPDRELRTDALEALACKRANIDGAALFWTLPRARSRDLLRLLVAYEILADYLDCTSERAAAHGIRNGLQLHRALIEAIDPSRPLSDYYRHHPWREDGGYIRALIGYCRRTAARLPSFAQVQPLAARAARLTTVLALNHEPDPSLRDTEIKAWSELHFPEGSPLAWFELAGGASAWLTVLALLALAADTGREREEVERTYAAYLPWVSLVGTMLDSYADVAEDREVGAHSYIAHYTNATQALERIGEILTEALAKVGDLPNGERHLALISCMVAMYLSKDSARTTGNLPATRQLARAASPLPWALIPAVRAWRVIYGLQTDGGGQQYRATADFHVPCAPRSTRLPPSAPAPATLQTLAFWRDPHRYLAWCRRRYGSRFTIRTHGLPPFVFMSDQDDIMAIVRAPADVLYPGAGAAVIAPLVGEGSFMLAEEDKHLEGRRAILPAFQNRCVRAHAEMINDIVRREVALWPRDRPVAIHPYLRALSLRVILRTIFGHETASHRELHTRLLRMLTITASLTLQEGQLRPIPPWRHLWRGFLSERAAVHGLIDELISEEAHAPARESGLLAMLLEGTASSEDCDVDHRQIRDDLMSVILAGHETTASELAWAFQLLAHNRATATSLVESLDNDEERYLAATVQEVLRHRPVFLFTIPRVVNAPFEIAGRAFHPPVHLMGCIYLMQHDPAIYEDPERFRPERFLAAEPPPEVWMPWGGGRKRCPGHHLAVLEMQLVLRTVLSELRVLPVGNRVETARWRSVIVTPGRGSRVLLRTRPDAKAPSKRFSRGSSRLRIL
jgi:tetraprenyl-beta-curcumene synthase